MLLQAFAHAFVSVTIAELGTTATTSNRSHAFSIDGIAGSTTVEPIERQKLASISIDRYFIINTIAAIG